jgi:FAD/FMN-containing dehydrogenase
MSATTHAVSGGVEALRAVVAGPVLTSADEGYDDARRVWNAAFDRRPAVIVECVSAADVAAAVRFARTEGLEITVRGGAHSIPGLSASEGGVVVSLRRLNAVQVDPDSRRVRVQGGALLGDVDAATQPFGLALPAGLISHTGIGGLTVGGGMGWLTRLGGLTIDNLVSAEVVVADGRILRAADDVHPDLFWAIRGGGGNFGIVTEFEFRLIEAGPTVQFGLFFWGEEQGPQALRLIREVATGLPRTMYAMPAAGLTAPPAPFVPVEHQGRTGYALLLVGFGDAAEHREVTEHVRAALPPLFDTAAPMPFVALQQLMDESNAWGFYCYDKSGFFEDLTDEMIDVLTDHVPRKTSPLSVLLFYRLDEAYSEAAEGGTAFGGGRTPRWGGFFIGLTPTPDMLPAEREWVRSLWTALRPQMMGEGTYVNALGTDETDRIRASYGPKYGRLAAIKATYDPENVFRRNINISAPRIPSPRAGESGRRSERPQR